MARRLKNNSSVSEDEQRRADVGHTTTPRDEDLATFDTMPADLRELVRECWFEMDCGQILSAYLQGAPVYAIAKFLIDKERQLAHPENQPPVHPCAHLTKWSPSIRRPRR